MSNPIVFPKGRKALWACHPFSFLLLFTIIMLFIGLLMVVDVQPVTALECTAGPHSGTISADQRWCETDNPHQVTGTITIQAGVTLTIDPGVQVQFATGTSLIISGSLQAVGNAGEGIIFTSTSPGSTTFRRVEFTPDSSAILDYVDISYAGGEAQAIFINSTNVSIDHSSIHDNTPTTAAIIIGNNSRLGVAPTIQNTSIKNNSGYAIRHGHFEEYPVYDNLTLSGNGQDAIALGSGTYNQNVTLDSRELGGGYFVAGSITIPSGIAFSLMPTTTLKLEEGGGIFIQSGALFNANGLETEPITITSTGEGVTFRRIQFLAGSSSSLSYCDITRAGSLQGVLWIESSDLVMDHCSIHDTSPGMGAVYLTTAGISPIIRDSSILNNSNYAIYQANPDMAPLYENLFLSGNGNQAVFVGGGSINRNVIWDSREISGVPFIAGRSINVTTGASLTLNPGTELRFPQAGGTGMGMTIENGASLIAEGNQAEPIVITSTGQGINWSTLYFSSGSSVHLAYCDISQAKNVQGVLSVYTSDLIVDHCTFHDNQPSMGTIWLNMAGITPSISNSSFVNNNTFPIYFNSPNVAPILENLTSSGTGTHAIAIAGGGIDTGRNWTIGQSGLPARILADISITASGFLTLDPGTTIQFMPNTSLSIFGGLYALGTTLKPITLTGTTQIPGSWKSLVFNDGSRAILDNVEISYGGASGQAMVRIGSRLVTMQNCKLHHAANDGLQVSNNKQPTLSYNHIYDNAFGLRNQTPATIVNATYHWWGDPTGPLHPTQNPGGLGNGVSDGVIFTPWLESPTQIGDLPIGRVYVDLVSQTRASPGQKVDYAIWYNNLSTTTVTNAVMVLNLPDTDFYKSSNAGGIYWASRHQVFWLIGDLEPGESGSMAVKTEYKWGIPDLTLEASMAIVLGNGLENGQLNPLEYYEYIPFEETSRSSLSENEFLAILPTLPDLQTLYTQMLDLGYVSGLFNRLIMNDGQVFTQAVMVKPDISELAFVTGNENGSLAYIITRSGITLINSSGVITFDPQTKYFYYPKLPGFKLNASTQAVSCLANCLISETGTSLLMEFLPFLGKASTARDCQAAAADPEDKAALASCVAGLSGLPAVGTVVSAVNCINASVADPQYCRCTESKWESTTYLRTNVEACRKTPCRDGMYASWDAGVTACPFCTKCISGTGGSENPWDHCKPTGATPPAECNKPGQQVLAGPIHPMTGQDDDIFDGMKICLLIPRDPNAKYGEAGDVIPGQEMNYTITYENEGAGRAYGVYITDILDDALDESTLSISWDYLYIPASRRIVWFVGELGPKGDPDSKGEVTFTVQLKENVPGGTAVTNQAIVYFPSVPEITPTNAVVNFVEEVTALPQQLETDYLTSIAVTLQGQDVGGGPLTFEVDQQPLFGVLTGTIPDLIYTPMENMTGQDKFTYFASNGITNSNSAEVTITVLPSANDLNPPVVLWVFPPDDSVNTPYRQSAAGEDDLGSIFAPFPILQFSEALDLASLTESDFRIIESETLDLDLSFSYDAYSNQVTLYPRSAYKPATWYTVEVSTGILDLAGNPLTEIFSYRFKTGLAVDLLRQYLPIINR